MTVLLIAVGVLAVLALGAWARLAANRANAQQLVPRVAQLLAEHQRTKAVRLTSAAGKGPSVQLLRFLLRLDIPRETLTDEPARYRGRIERTEFATAARQLAEQEAARLRRSWRLGGVLPVGSALLAIGLCLLGMEWCPEQSSGTDICTLVDGIAPYASIGLLFVAIGAASTWRQIDRGLDSVLRVVLPRLRSTEELTDEDRRAIRKAGGSLPKRAEQG